MEQHRAEPDCASCHARMDPLGFGLENFDAIGAWRDKDGEFADRRDGRPAGRPVVPRAGRTEGDPDGEDQAVHPLPDRENDDLRPGPGPGVSDHCAVEEIAESLPQDDDRFSKLISAIVNSDPFQKRGVEGSHHHDEADLAGRCSAASGTAVALPWLEAMAPLSPTPAAPRATPRRMAFLYVPNGVHMPDWTPTGRRRLPLPPSSNRWRPFKEDLLVLTGLTQDKALPTATAGATTPGRSPAS